MPSATTVNRTCIVCRIKADRRSLIRIGKNAGGTLAVLHSHPAQGRSAYVCPRPECTDGATAKGRLERALRCPVEQQALKDLHEQFRAAQVNSL